MRSIWSGAISFGLVNIPVKLYKAFEEDSLDFDMLAKQDLSPIRYMKVAASDGREVAFKDIVKGYQIEKGNYVVLSESDFTKVNIKKSKLIEILSFASEDEIDPVYFEKPYYLEPDKNAEKTYALLREALKKSKKVGIASFTLRSREHIAIIKTYGDVIILNQLRYNSTIRKPSDLNLPETGIISAKEIEMGVKLIDQLTEKFKPALYKDTYIDELKKIIEAKSKGKIIHVKSETPPPTHVKDLMSVLKASLEAPKPKKPPIDRPAIKKVRTIKKPTIIKTSKH